ncbi:hypothetical protein HDA40_003757 [Hamadaea flava]|uniref:DUF1643 domain-containing protein n=1 Tax=Hamadaea flava TaxID=1742688 RepID=A0ABV8LI35_9ACTN|nr:DUF1643 domain-containing protein [Hamadaea flava]MCP2325250.1 hypothetical protein [Hamadaea flava]
MSVELPTRTLCAVLLNPALKATAQTTSFRNLSAALPVTSCGGLTITNLLDVPTKDKPQLLETSITAHDLERSRHLLAAALGDAQEVLFGWGCSASPGPTGRLLRQQADWLMAQLAGRFTRFWQVAGGPRHPSRWRQFVGPEKGRVEGSSYEDRLAKVLAEHPVGDADAGLTLVG